MHFLLDANMPRSAVESVSSAGHDCTHVRDTPLADAPDSEIAEYARVHQLTLVTRDFDFADIRRYPPEQYAGIVVISTVETADAMAIARLVVTFLAAHDCLANLSGRLAIVEVGRVRLRPMPADEKP